jgi:hypothetical protein
MLLSYQSYVKAEVAIVLLDAILASSQPQSDSSSVMAVLSNIHVQL